MHYFSQKHKIRDHHKSTNSVARGNMKYNTLLSGPSGYHGNRNMIAKTNIGAYMSNKLNSSAMSAYQLS